VNLSTEQAEKAVEHLSNGSRIVEAARMVETAWSAFASDWTAGRTDSESNCDTPEASFYRAAQAARARHCATKRALAAATAGSRESADILAYVRALESEEEPLVENIEQPNAVRLLESDDPAVVNAARAVGDATREMLRALTAKDARAREARATA
jgi:hypothetical protein